jgi:hypothetical protein
MDSSYWFLIGYDTKVNRLCIGMYPDRDQTETLGLGWSDTRATNIGFENRFLGNQISHSQIKVLSPKLFFDVSILYSTSNHIQIIRFLSFELVLVFRLTLFLKTLQFDPKPVQKRKKWFSMCSLRCSTRWIYQKQFWQNLFFWLCEIWFPRKRFSKPILVALMSIFGVSI